MSKQLNAKFFEESTKLDNQSLFEFKNENYSQKLLNRKIKKFEEEKRATQMFLEGVLVKDDDAIQEGTNEPNYDCEYL